MLPKTYQKGIYLSAYKFLTMARPVLCFLGKQKLAILVLLPCLYLEIWAVIGEGEKQ